MCLKYNLFTHLPIVGYSLFFNMWDVLTLNAQLVQLYFILQWLSVWTSVIARESNVSDDLGSTGMKHSKQSPGCYELPSTNLCYDMLPRKKLWERLGWAMMKNNEVRQVIFLQMKNTDWQPQISEKSCWCPTPHE